MNQYITVLCTTPSKEVAESIAELVVQKGLAACANTIHGVHSIYTWKGETCRDNEYLMIFKTRGNLFEQLRMEISSNHPYEVPEIIALPILEGHRPYLDWIEQVTVGIKGT